MTLLIRISLFVLLFQASLTHAADVPRSRPDSPTLSFTANDALTKNGYYWSSMPVGATAELITLNCHRCGRSELTDSESDVPLLSVLRDTLGDSSSRNDRLSYLWLLSAGHFTLGQRVLSAVPFFYWRLGSGAAPVGPGYPSPLLNLNAPRHRVIAQAGRSLVQWTAFDPLATSVRASSRSYQANQVDNERLHLEQAIGYLNNSTAASGDGLTEREVNTLVARLELRKSLLGGLLNNQRAARFGQHARFEDERIRSRNFEAMRQFAEKTGTYFEPLNMAGNTGEFVMLWFPANSSHPLTGTPAKPIWKLLNIRDPWSDPDLAEWRGLTFQRAFDADGKLLPLGSEGVRTTTLIPLAVYSLSYPRMPLLLVDFRDKLHVRRHEVIQRTITEFTGGILGLSHFANWYYYAGAFAYQIIWSRRGTASNQADRLDSYSQFRMELALDHQLDPQLRQELNRRAHSLNVNPLDTDPARSVSNARTQYARLEKAAQQNRELPARLDRERRAELASFGESTGAGILQDALHVLSFGAYTHRVGEDQSNLAALDRDRRISYQLEYLDSVVQNGTDPHVAFNSAQIDDSVQELRTLLDGVNSERVQLHARATLERLQGLVSGGEQIAKSHNKPVQTAENATLIQ